MHRRNKSGVEHTAEGIGSQIKGNVKEAWGDLTDDRSTQVNGKIDRLKGKIQEEYGRAKTDQEKRRIDDDDTVPM